MPVANIPTPCPSTRGQSHTACIAAATFGRRPRRGPFRLRRRAGPVRPDRRAPRPGCSVRTHPATARHRPGRQVATGQPGRRRLPDRLEAGHPARARRRPRVLVVWLYLGYRAVLERDRQGQRAAGQAHAGPSLTPAGNILTDPQVTLVLGSDSRGEDTARADSILLMRTDPGKHRSHALDPARPAGADPGHGPNKINAAYAYGGTPLLIRTIDTWSPVQVNHVVLVDFSGFKDLIDSLGGVTIYNPRKISRRSPSTASTGSSPRADPPGRPLGAGLRAHPPHHQPARHGHHPHRAPAAGDAGAAQQLVSPTTSCTCRPSGSALGKPLTTDLSANELLGMGWVKFRAQRTRAVPPGRDAAGDRRPGRDRCPTRRTATWSSDVPGQVGAAAGAQGRSSTPPAAPSARRRPQASAAFWTLLPEPVALAVLGRRASTASSLEPSPRRSTSLALGVARLLLAAAVVGGVEARALEVDRDRVQHAARRGAAHLALRRSARRRTSGAPRTCGRCRSGTRRSASHPISIADGPGRVGTLGPRVPTAAAARLTGVPPFADVRIAIVTDFYYPLAGRHHRARGRPGAGADRARPRGHGGHRPAAAARRRSSTTRHGGARADVRDRAHGHRPSASTCPAGATAPRPRTRSGRGWAAGWAPSSASAASTSCTCTRPTTRR